MAERLADALAGPDADEDTRERLRNEARAAAAGIDLTGLGYGSGRTVRSFDPEDPAIEMLDAYDDLPLDLKQSTLEQIQSMVRALHSQRSDIVGKRAETEEPGEGV
jgi:hypothetical protein